MRLTAFTPTAQIFDNFTSIKRFSDRSFNNTFRNNTCLVTLLALRRDLLSNSGEGQIVGVKWEKYFHCYCYLPRQALLRGALAQQCAVILVCMAVDRYTCALYPQKYHQHSSKKVSDLLSIKFLLFAHFIDFIFRTEIESIKFSCSFYRP